MWYPRAFLKWSSLALCLTVCNAFAADEARCLPGYIFDEDIDECVADTAEEEIIVTGSFIRRDNFDLPSPMNVIDSLDLEMAATPDLGDVLFDQTFQVGVNANAAPFEFGGGDDQNWQQGGEVWANLRGLGTRATMTMMDSHRVPANVTGYSWWTRRAGTDVTNLYPGIAIGRVETILDGASALYGSEAVSGVVNLIPRKNFEGLMMNYEVQQATDAGAPQKRMSLLAGAQGERTSIIFALEIRDGERMKLTDRPDYIQSSANWTGQYLPPYNEMGRGNPGDWSVPVRGTDGALQPYNGGAWYQYQGQWMQDVTWAPLADNSGRNRSVRHVDPGCGFEFGSGASYLPHLNPIGDPARPAATLEAQDYLSGLAVTDHSVAGNFYNGFMTGEIAGLSAYEGTEGQYGGSRQDCRQVISDFQDIESKRDQQQAFAYFEHELNDYVKIKGEMVVSTMDYGTRDVVGNLDEMDRISLMGMNTPMVIGENPGNPFHAFADGSNGFPADSYLSYTDSNNNGIYDYLEEPGEYYVFAQDANGDGIPDRDWDGDGVADLNAQGDVESRVLLQNYCSDPTAEWWECVYGVDSNGDGLVASLADADGDGLVDRFDPDSGGVHLFEDVRLIDMSIAPKQPHGNTISWLNDDMSYNRRRQIDNLRIRLGAEITIPDTEWIVDFDWISAWSKREEDYAEPVWPWTVASMRCQGGQMNDACWNPFSTAWLDSNEYGQLLEAWRNPDNPAANTELEHRYAGVLLRHDQRNIRMDVIDAVVSNGAIFDLPWNDSPVGLAAGIHMRLESEEYRPNQLGASALGSARTNFQYTEEETNAVFVEFQLPLINSPKWGDMELQLAMRYAEFEARGSVSARGQKAEFDTTIPKIAFRYSPTDWLAVRASLTEGFVLPGMFQLFNVSVRPDNFQNVYDYICDNMPELEDCNGVGQGGSVPDVLVADSQNAGLSAEVSDLWNVGTSLRLLDGDLTMDVDYTKVTFNGRVERMGASGNLASAGIGFQPYASAACPGTQLDYDNAQAAGPDGTWITPPDYIAQTSQNELECRLNAALSWVANEEEPIGNTVIVRGGGENGLRLMEADNPWLNQGEQGTTTLIYNLRYRVDAADIPYIGGDYGTFEVGISATQMLELYLMRYAADSGHTFAGIEVDGVGNRNNGAHWFGTYSLYQPLPVSPEWRVNGTLRWFRDNHTAQMTVRWHDSVTDVDAAWDEVKHIPGALPTEHNGISSADIPESEACADQDRNPYCEISERTYVDFSYTYTAPDLGGFGYVSLNLAARNIFDSMPDPIPSGAGYEPYLDNIMGRTAFARLTVGF
ncbi:MAG TPA: hypothetical protein EYM33_03080 [Pseudomonadales bacterium]|nr:hypothetical protein [Pseudomonadales bacterium]